jgi:hypothetical protein
MYLGYMTLTAFPIHAKVNPNTIAAVIADSPVDGYTTADGAWPVLSWTAGAGASAPNGYRLQVSTSSNFSSKIVDECVRGTTYSPVDAWWAQTKMGTFYWRVNYVSASWTTQAQCKTKPMVNSQWSSVKNFINPVAAKSPLITAPENGTASTDGLWRELTWTPAAGDFGGFGYRIQVHRKSTFAGPGSVVDECTVLPTYVPTSADWMRTQNGTFYWRVTYVTRDWRSSASICKASYVEKSLWSNVRMFRNVQPSNPVVAVSPADAQTSTDGLWPTLQWNAGADMPVTHGYRIQVSKVANFTTLIVDECTKSTSYTPADNWWAQERMGVFYWRVNYAVSSWKTQAQCKAQRPKTSLWSASRSFENPVTSKLPILSTPADGVISTDGLWPTLGWSSALGDFGGFGYRIQVSKTSNFSRLIVDECTTSTSYLPASEAWARMQTGKFYWRVNYVTRAWSGNQTLCKRAFVPTGLWSTIRTFTNP